MDPDPLRHVSRMRPLNQSHFTSTLHNHSQLYTWRSTYFQPHLSPLYKSETVLSHAKDQTRKISLHRQRKLPSKKGEERAINRVTRGGFALRRSGGFRRICCSKWSLTALDSAAYFSQHFVSPAFGRLIFIKVSFKRLCKHLSSIFSELQSLFIFAVITVEDVNIRFPRLIFK